MIDLFFVDTNLLVYRHDASEKEKQPKAEAWYRELWKRQAGRLSAQVLNEFYQVVTRKLVPGLAREVAREEVRDLLYWQPVPMTGALLIAAWDLEERYSLSLWDSLIVAAAQSANCRFLISEDLADGQELAGVRVVDPFKYEPLEFAGPSPTPR